MFLSRRAFCVPVLQPVFAPSRQAFLPSMEGLSSRAFGKRDPMPQWGQEHSRFRSPDSTWTTAGEKWKSFKRSESYSRSTEATDHFAQYGSGLQRTSNPMRESSLNARLASDPSLVLTPVDWALSSDDDGWTSAARGALITYSPTKIKVQYQVIVGCSNGNQFSNVGNHHYQLDCAKQNHVDNLGAHAAGNIDTATNGPNAAKRMGKRVLKGAMHTLSSVLPCLLV